MSSVRNFAKKKKIIDMSKITQNCFLHVDINAYFATLLQQETPTLRGKPIAVVKDVGRTCVIAASKEAKLLGIKTGVSLHEAHVRAKNLVVLPADFNMYLSATKKLKDLFESLSPEIEIFSLDEAFIYYTPLWRMYKSPEIFGKIIQDRIRKILGSFVTCNVGIGENRFLAKMIGETSPKGSVSRVFPETKDALLARTSFDDVCGIGTRLAYRLARFGITVPYQINFIQEDVLEASFGPFWSVELKKMARGAEPLFLERLNQELPHMKSVGRSITGFSLCSDESSVRRIIYNLAEEVMRKVRKMGLAGRQISMYLYGRDVSWRAHITLKYYVRHTKEFIDILFNQLLPQRTKQFPVIKFGIYLGLLKPWSTVPQPLFPSWWRQERLEEAKDELATRYGLFTVKGGLLLDSEIILPEVTGFLGDKQYQFLKDSTRSGV